MPPLAIASMSHVTRSTAHDPKHAIAGFRETEAKKFPILSFAGRSGLPVMLASDLLAPETSTSGREATVSNWVGSIGLDPAAYGTHTLRRTKATLIYRRTRNLRAVQLLLGHTKLESTVRYLGIEVDDALEIAEQTEV